MLAILLEAVPLICTLCQLAIVLVAAAIARVTSRYAKRQGAPDRVAHDDAILARHQAAPSNDNPLPGRLRLAA